MVFLELGKRLVAGHDQVEFGITHIPSGSLLDEDCELLPYHVGASGPAPIFSMDFHEPEGVWVMFKPFNKQAYITPLPSTAAELKLRTFAKMGIEGEIDHYDVLDTGVPLGNDVALAPLCRISDRTLTIDIAEALKGSPQEPNLRTPATDYVLPDTRVCDVLRGTRFAAVAAIMDEQELDTLESLSYFGDTEWRVLRDGGLSVGAMSFLRRRTAEAMLNAENTLALEVPASRRKERALSDFTSEEEPVGCWVLWAPTNTTMFLTPVPPTALVMKELFLADLDAAEAVGLESQDIAVFLDEGVLGEGGDPLPDSAEVTSDMLKTHMPFCIAPVSLSDGQEEGNERMMRLAMRAVLDAGTQRGGFTTGGRPILLHTLSPPPPFRATREFGSTPMSPLRESRHSVSVPVSRPPHTPSTPLMSSCAMFYQRFKVCEQLGQGQFATVWRCVHRASGNEFAVKVINKEVVSRRVNNLEVLYAEVAIWKSVIHPNIIRVISVFEDNRELLIVMELARGGELFDRIIELGKYTEDDAVRCVRNIVSAICYLHLRGIVHRDLKPENILLATSEHDAIKLTDFGLARVVTDAVFLSSACGTPGFMAPEVVRVAQHKEGGGSFGTKSDMWSVGVITYMLVVGYPPFEGDDLIDLLDMICACEVEYHDDDWSEVKPYAKDFVQRLLTEKPEDRMSADEALRHPWLTVRSHLTNGLMAQDDALDTPLNRTVGSLQRYSARNQRLSLSVFPEMAQTMRRMESESSLPASPLHPREFRHSPSSLELRHSPIPMI